MGSGHDDGDERDHLVVVPHRPGPLVALDESRPGRARDDLDDLIDDLVPDVEEGAGWFDLALVAIGAGLLAWTATGTAPSIAAAAGAAALGLGMILPARTAWRRVRRRRDERRRAARLSRGVPLAVSSAEVADLVRWYRELVRLAGRIAPADATPALSAAHGAVTEVATLLGGRPPASDRELAYVEARREAVAALVATLRPLADAAAAGPPVATEDGPDLSAEAVLSAREELDDLAASSSVARLDELTAELRDRGHGRP